jgi:hypothetical protein
MHTFKLFFCFIVGLIFANDVLSTDQALFPDNQLFETVEFTQALPIITCDSNTFQFSNVLEGQIIKHIFSIKNSGDTILRIYNVKTGCGCSSATYDKEIPPGQSGSLTLKIDTEGYGGKTYKEVVHIISNDPNAPDFKLTASGPVDSLANVSPKNVCFKGKCTALHETMVKIEPNDHYSFDIVGVDLGKLKDKIECTLTRDESAYLLSVRNRLKCPGRYWGKIVLNTDHQKKKQLDLWVSANLK